MRPKELILCGWGPYKSEERVDFAAFEKSGIFLITGATGAGKTTIFDAVSYALYGALSGEERDRERKGVRSDFADAATPTYVELLMEHGGKTYRIRRNPEYLRPRKRGAGQFTAEKENAALTFPDGRVLEGVKEVNAALKELLVLDYEQFKKISMIAQGEFARLLVAPPREKTGIFREIFGTEVLERFTQELSVRAAALYRRVAEQRHKLEEDVRVLTAGLEGSGWSEEHKEELEALSGAEALRLDAVLSCLDRMEREAAERGESSKRILEEADRVMEGLHRELAALEEENRQILELRQAEKRLSELQGQEKLFGRKQETYNRSMNAGWVEGAEEKKRQQESLLRRNGEDRRKLEGRLSEEAEILAERQQAYLERESACRAAKEAWEEAQRRWRLQAVGLAAELLEEGRPCPVCGSLEHPSPAGPSEETLSEDALKKLKARVSACERELAEAHEQAVRQKAGLDALGEQRERLAGEGEELGARLLEAEQAFLEALREYGFADEADYRGAKLSKRQREDLLRELEEYRGKLAASGELCRHLRESVRGSEPLDLSGRRADLERSRADREAAMRECRLWERHADEVKRTRELLAEKRAQMEKESEEYGYVKDLENLASGKNSRRLVFEQYVLAGYFEEILRAANLRFLSMTGGRYEMFRVEQVGDGRVRDNLEIEVLDYYTGKRRSVRTLSGGESFKASLALALGMSDVIQAMNGGVRVDTLFVDEGFGALDEESLDQACGALTGLAQKRQLIGIISHVPELRERIPAQLVIERTGSGSRIKSCG